MFKREVNRLVWEYDGERVWIEPWGTNSLRFRATKGHGGLCTPDWALLPQKEIDVPINIADDGASISNGKLTCRMNHRGAVQFLNHCGEVLLEEHWRDRQVEGNPSALLIPGRELKPIPGGKYSARVLFKASDGEKLYGMGQHQEPFLNLKGCELELAQRNSQVNIPFVLSNRGFGFLWHNPAYGHVTFARNYTKWTAEVTSGIDYWVTAGNSPAEINESYTQVTGRAPMMPEFAAGFWQSKLRYQTQEELMEVAREYKRRGLPMSVIVIDFFHWTQQGEWRFDHQCWPDPASMVRELKEMGIEVMVSIWPTVDPSSENYEEMKVKGYLVNTDRGVRTQLIVRGNEVFFDATNPDARRYVWDKVNENYFRYGIRVFWLDEAEPEIRPYDFDNIRYYLGPGLEVGNIYPALFAKGFYDGMTEEGVTDVINLVRCAWAGSQRYGAAVWSGDIHSSFEALQTQVRAGLNMSLSGIPWWTTDIGGFSGGDPEDESFRELLVRWFQYGTFCPICRLHGFRKASRKSPISTGGAAESGVRDFETCGPNEVWSYGEEVYGIVRELLFLRERLQPYIMQQMENAHSAGTPPMRPLFYDFPDDEDCWDIDDEFMFGPDILVAPVIHKGVRTRTVYLPAGVKWKEAATGKTYNGGQGIDCDAPLHLIPVFLKNGAQSALFEPIQSDRRIPDGSKTESRATETV